MNENFDANQQADELYMSLRTRLNDNPDDVNAAVGLGNIYYDANQPAQAILYYRLALDIDPSQPAVMTDMGTMYWHNENIPQAECAYREVIKDYPGFGNAYLNLGYLLLHAKNQVPEARKIWTELITGWPEDPVAQKIRELLVETTFSDIN